MECLYRPICISLSWILFAAFGSVCPAAERFERILLSEEFHSEGATFADIDSDGDNDIVSGPYWYEGPDFRVRHAYMPGERFAISGYSRNFFVWPYDFNGDRRPDIFMVGFPGHPAAWFENPGKKDGHWPRHPVMDDVGNESPDFADINGDDRPELICLSGGIYGYAEFDPQQPTSPWKFTPITPKLGYGHFTHGLGIGDVDGDGRPDLLETNGWWRQTEKRGELFEFHPQRFAQSGGSQMFAYDFDGDGDDDVLSVQNAHGWGLTWFENRGDGTDIAFIPHEIMTQDPGQNPHGLAISQMHAMALVDIDGDGIKDIVTGKRFWAHGGHDSGARQLPVLYWFRTLRRAGGVEFVPQFIDRRSGVGTQLTVGDVTADGHPDILVASKLGTFLMKQVADAPVVDEPHVLETAVGTNEIDTLVRNTDPLSTEEERERFILPAGFEAELVAAEPDIAKPMNLAFDARGRLWISSSLEYPYAAPADRPGKDTITIHEDSNGDGRFDKVTTFAEGLNIPMGLYPYQDGVICFSIPNIIFLRDTDGDDRADQRETLVGPFDTTRDVHGLCNAFKRGLDGWLYACHGFNNQSTVAGSNGHSIHMPSGNTFRMRLDGSRIEHVGHGQVNPFGMAFNRWGDMFTADCHTKPINMVLRGGYHDSFGRPHDGLGYVPNVMEHLHNSTGIGGIALGESSHFPGIYRQSTFGGNVVTSRINRNTLVYSAASVHAQAEPDFLISEDPWFRPVDLQIGPDGALYVADFYNRIIGHYEVPLTHPGRDRKRGRVWRIVYRPTDSRRDAGSQSPRQDASVNSASTTDIAGLSLDQLFDQLASHNYTRRSLVTDRITDEFGSQAIEPARERHRTANDVNIRVHSLWILHRLSAIDENDLQTALTDKDAQVRVHALHLLGELPPEQGSFVDKIKQGFEDPQPLVRRAAARAAGLRPHPSLIAALTQLDRETSQQDHHLRHTIRIALKNHLSNEEWFAASVAGLSPADERIVMDVCLALKSQTAGEFVASRLDFIENEPAKLQEFVRFCTQYGSAESLAPSINSIRNRFEGDMPFQIEVLRTIQAAKGGKPLPAAAQDWALHVVSKLLNLDENGQLPADENLPLSWSTRDISGSGSTSPVFTVSKRRASADGQSQALLWSSFPAGEQATGVFRSQTFDAPAELSFYIAGHDGPPGEPLQGKNLIRLRDTATGEVIQQSAPPRSDVAQQVRWDLSDWTGRKVTCEIVDRDAGSAFAWLAVGRFSYTPLNPNDQTEHRQIASELIRSFDLTSLRTVVKQLVLDASQSSQTRAAMAKTWVAWNPDSRLAALSDLGSMAAGEDLLEGAYQAISERDLLAAATLLKEAMQRASTKEQYQLARPLVTDGDGVSTLLDLIEDGSASTALLARPDIAQSLKVLADEAEQARIEQLSEHLPQEDEQVAKLIASRRESFLNTQYLDVGHGGELFKKHCGICHKVGDAGEQVGPNLDGIGNRGINRLLEDVLAPNRNVDVAFRAATVVTLDGRALSGLIKQDEETHVVLIDNAGKEIRVPREEVDEIVPSSLSPMPANFGEALSEDEFHALMAYLISIRE